MARRKKGRPIDGVLVIDKPTGISSNRVVQRVKGSLNAQKVGHTGALDPMATGVLPLVLGEASKFSQYGLDADKAYLGRVQFGVATDTLDADGTVIETASIPELSMQSVEPILAQFRGVQQQLPPLISALKQDGQPYYKLARDGVEIERTPREVTIHALTVEAIGPAWIDLSVRCSKGTYIRTLAENIGRALGSVAHLSQLRRVDAGGLDLTYAVTLDHFLQQLEDGTDRLESFLRPVDTLVAHFPKVQLSENDCMTLIHGQKVTGQPMAQCDTMRAYCERRGFIGLIAQDETGVLRAKRMLSPTAAGMRGSSDSGP